MNEWYKDCDEVIKNFSFDYNSIKNNIWNSRDKIFSIKTIRASYKELYINLYKEFGISDYTDLDLLVNYEFNRELFPLDNIDEQLRSIIVKFDSIQKLRDKYIYLSNLNIPDSMLLKLLERIPIRFKNHCMVVGKDRFSAFSYTPSVIENEYRRLLSNKSINISESIYSVFKEGDKYERSEIKEKLKQVYNSSGYDRSPKASDIEEWFEIKDCKLYDSVLKKQNHGYLLIKRKKIKNKRVD